MLLKFLTLALCCLSSNVVNGLVFPAASVYQITSCVSAPIEIPDRKIFLDWCLQMSYDLPSSPKQFYNVPIWANIFKDRQSRQLLGNATTYSASIDYGKYGQGTDVSVEPHVHPSDFTAGELYHSLEYLLERYGLHETCLLRSVCELARHPFAEDSKNILTEILTFLLSPSLHQAFGSAEQIYKTVYTEAEEQGQNGEDCAAIYNECQQDLITGISKIITHS